MILELKGHDYKYAVEQIMLMMYPDERPVYGIAGADTLSAEVCLTYGETCATAVTRVYSGDRVYRGLSRARRALLTDKLAADRLLQKILKLSFYKAAREATGKTPVWGALTGIRPGKLASGLLERGFTERRARAVLENEYFVSPERAALCIDTARASLDVKKTLEARDIALYVGIPFCPTRCHYCSFVSHSVEKSIKLIAPFLEALHREIDALAPLVHDLGLNVAAVYIGGGTPTTLDDRQLDRLMVKLRASFDLTNIREYTVEAGRPDTITPEKLEAIRRNGADRISINPQSMSDGVLRAIGRRHTAQDMVNAVARARAAGFDCINMDLIAGLPADTAGTFASSLDAVLSLDPENVTVHTLALKKGTRLTLEGTDLPGAGEVSAMLDYAGERLRGGGYEPYYLYRQKFMSGGFENVGWCREGSASLYNILIMEELATILALGGGGVTKLVRQDSGRIERIFNLKYPYEYIENIDRVLEHKARIVPFCSGQLSSHG
ncbi:oxygen-independent coproporphyrinogen-3 oxidase [Sporobacter termitidis DSM 10068]|uniref:Oxygen-independent coproporphyrinogen-3 oxidase n=1 Tax=Sporobacter termitidis DSM 10068 TaxID=1123282 RepID=A0A1M5Z4C2_9FIRM|nr:coproporphyrinogen dehydrogenase HemZ [Sporobacter termitidis]SHI19070.1 oxygen-independent coproporphyrinogen-3 oxidase [Sporobacter termitidis DSM 10068]